MLLGYETLAEAKKGFAWNQRWSLFDGGRDGFNLAHECLGRHVAAGRGKDVGARIVRADGTLDIITFEELERLASAIGRVLQGTGVGPGDAVAVRLEPTREFIAALYGCLYAGAVFVPCTPLLGTSATIARIADAAPKVTLVEDAAVFEGWKPDGIVIDRPGLMRAIAGVSDGVAKVATMPEHPAIYIYSSGTTGRPKRTVMQHQGFTYLAAIVGKMVVGLEPIDRYIACYAPGYVGGFGWGLLVPMSVGTAGGIYAGKFHADVLMRAITELNITAMHCPPTAYRRLIHAYDGRPTALRKLAYTAEAMDVSLANQIKAAFGCYARGQYGATEVGMVAIDYAYPDYSVRPGTVGKPLLGADVVIVDAQGRDLGPDQTGRIALRRAGRLLYSGDYGTWDADGYIWFKGRADNVIITSGYTIGAEEIEEVMQDHPAVDSVAVMAKPDEQRGNIIKAFVQPTHDAVEGDALRAELQEHVRRRLGQYAYPREIEFVAEFQRNEAGKIVRASLRGVPQ